MVMYQPFRNLGLIWAVCSVEEGSCEGSCLSKLIWEGRMTVLLSRLWTEDEGQDIAEYAVMLAVILVIVVGTIRLVGSNANNVFSSAASAIQ